MLRHLIDIYLFVGQICGLSALSDVMEVEAHGTQNPYISVGSLGH